MPEATARKSLPTCMPERIGLAENKRHDWVVDVPISVCLEDVMEPSYWAHVSAEMDPLDHIEVRSEDSSWVADLIVQFCERNYAIVVLKQLVKLDPTTEVPITSIKHKVEWKGGIHRWSVIRLADSQMLQSSFKSKELAHAWLIEHEKTVGTK